MSDAWREIHNLRKSGCVDEAERLGKVKLAEEPNNNFLRSTLAWVYYERLKILVTPLKAGKERIDAVDSQVVRRIEQCLRDYARIKPQVPDLCHSQILRQLGHVGRHVPAYGGFLKWAGYDCFVKPDDFIKGQKDSREFPPLALSVAREAAAWFLQDAKTREPYSDWILTFALRAEEQEHDEVWIDLDLARIYRVRGDADLAMRYMCRVLSSKSTDFWAWAQAAEILATDGSQELAISAYCRALSCKATDDFLVRVRIALAKLLAAESEFDWALAEIQKARATYEHNDWRLPKELVSILASDWVRNAEPSAPALFDFKAAYASRAPLTRSLLYEIKEEVHGSFVGIDHWLKRPRYAVRTNNDCTGLLGYEVDAYCAGLKPGAPVFAVIGRSGSDVALLSVRDRPDGTLWDCIPEAKSLRQIDETSIRRFTGTFRGMPQGFGFIQDVFVEPALAAGPIQDGQIAEIIARRSFDKRKNDWSWKACAVVHISDEDSRTLGAIGQATSG